MDGFLGVVFRKALDLDLQLAKFAVTYEPIENYLATMSACTLPRQEGQGAMTGCLELPMRHRVRLDDFCCCTLQNGIVMIARNISWCALAYSPNIGLTGLTVPAGLPSHAS